METKHEHIGALILVIKDSKILLGKRINAYMAGSYGTPGGRVETSEKILEALKRELVEETGLESNTFGYVGVVRENQGSYSFVHFGFATTDFTGIPENKEPHKCEGWDWYSFDALPKGIIPGHKAIIEMHLNPGLVKYRDI